MSETSPSPGNTQAPNSLSRPKRKTRIILAIIGIGFVLWNIVSTEMRVAQLRDQGFSDFVISSTRNHAYFPMIGAILGSALFIGAGMAIKRLMRRQRL